MKFHIRGYINGRHCTTQIYSDPRQAVLYALSDVINFVPMPVDTFKVVKVEDGKETMLLVVRKDDELNTPVALVTDPS